MRESSVSPVSVTLGAATLQLEEERLTRSEEKEIQTGYLLLLVCQTPRVMRSI